MTGHRRPTSGLLRLLFVSGIALAGLAMIGTITWHYFQDTQAIAATLARAEPWLGAWRASFFIGLVGAWPKLIDGLAKHYGWVDTQRQHVLAQRWRVAAWLVIIELLLVQNIAGRFVNALVP